MYNELPQRPSDGKGPDYWARQPFAGKTEKVPRPDRSQPAYERAEAYRLKQAQEQWDEADQARKDREAWLAQISADKQAKADEEASRKAVEAKAKSDADRAATLGTLKDRFLRTPGTTEADWNALNHDQVLSNYAMSRALSGESEQSEEAARRAHSRSYVG